MVKFLQVCFVIILTSIDGLSLAAGIYTIQARMAHNLFVINNQFFEAKSACAEFEKSDPIMFIDGDPYGDCDTAIILNLINKKRCEVTCPIENIETAPPLGVKLERD